jgi:hypothetical protein
VWVLGGAPPAMAASKPTRPFNVAIPPFVPETQLWPHMSAAVIGKKGRGKSAYVIRSSAWYLRDQVETVVSFIPTAKQNHDPDWFVPDAFNYPRWDQKRLEGIVGWCKDKADVGQRINVLFVFDDCNGVSEEVGKTVKKTRKVNIYQTAPFGTMLTEGRHFGAGFIVGLQNAFDAPMDARNQFNIVFAFSNPNKREREKIHEDYCDTIDKDAFMRIFEQVTAERSKDEKRCIVILPNEIGRDAANPLAGLYSWAPPLITTKFRCGKPQYYNLSAAVFAPPPPPVLDPWKAGGKDEADGDGGLRAALAAEFNVIVPEGPRDEIEPDDAELLEEYDGLV